MAVLLRFFSGNTEPERGKNVSKKEKVFDFTEDADYIYAAFFQDYGIDLSVTDMHWYKFLALFNGLSENTKLRKIIAWRGVRLSDIKDAKLREQYRKIKSFYRLKGDNRSAISADGIADELSRAF